MRRTRRPSPNFPFLGPAALHRAPLTPAALGPFWQIRLRHVQCDTASGCHRAESDSAERRLWRLLAEREDGCIEALLVRHRRDLRLWFRATCQACHSKRAPFWDLRLLARLKSGNVEGTWKGGT